MAVCTNTEVFNFMGTPADVVTKQGAQITALIAEQTALFEQITGRKAESTAFTDVFFYDGHNCEIYGSKMYLRGIYRDLLTISSITEDGTALSLATNTSSNGYYLDLDLGIIERVGAELLKGQMAYKITGTCGLSSSDVKVIIIEMVSAKSGLWKSNVQTEDGAIETIRTSISQDAKDLLNKYTLREV